MKSPPNTQIPKKQHMVPQFLLRNFTDSTTGKLHAFDKKTGKTFPVNVRDAAERNGFYNFEHEGKRETLEFHLADLDGEAAAVISKIKEDRQVGHLSSLERQALAPFFAVQMQRVQQSRDWQQQLVDHIRARIEEWGEDPAQVENFNDPSPEEVRKGAILGILESGRMARHFLDKVWMLQEGPRDPSLLDLG